MSDAPLRVHGSAVSYYTGKIEAYLRYKEIPYVRVALGPAGMRRLQRETGASQMPAVELPDGRILTDTTPTIAWLEERHPEPPVIPRDPLQAFAIRLLEDYAEELVSGAAARPLRGVAGARAGAGPGAPR